MEDHVAPSSPSQPNLATRSPSSVQPFQESFLSQSRTSSNARPYPQQPQPIKDAVSNAFERSATTNQLDSNFIARVTAQVTEQVIRNLQQANIGNANTPSSLPSQSHSAKPPPPNSESVPRSPTQSNTAFSEPRYTPPISPPKDPQQTGSYRYASVSPDVKPSDDGDSTYSTYSRQSQASVHSIDSRRSEATPRPFKNHSSPKASNFRRTSSSSGDEIPRQRKDSHRRTGRANTSSRRQSQNSEASFPYMDGTASNANRPSKPSPNPEDAEETTLEKVWQPLFDNGNPTMRLGQFLRGIAVHLIDDYEPKRSLVVTPKKMARFFQDTTASTEHYPWAIIFDGGMKNRSISTMYRKLLCQHHFVQVQNHDEPNVPALTPSGFEWFMTCLIQAHPNTEFERLSKTVMNMPISNSDNKTERFPKELPRRLLPAQPNMQAAQRMVASLAHEPSVTMKLSNNDTMPPPPASNPPPPSGPPREESSFKERERAPYSRSTFSSSLDDEDIAPPPRMPIERERKPYTAGEGTGKHFDSDDEKDRDPRPKTSQYRPEPPSRSNRAGSNTNAPPTSNSYSSSTEARPIPPPNSSRQTHRYSQPAPPPPSLYNPKTSSHRRSSPQPYNPYIRSDPTDLHDIPPSHYTSNHNRHHDFYPEPNSNSANQDDRRYPRPADFDPRGRPIPGRQQQPQIWEQGYAAPPGSHGSNSGSGGGGVVSSESFEERRRSLWAGSGSNNGPGGGFAGTDRYGSFDAQGGGAGGGPLLGSVGGGIQQQQQGGFGQAPPPPPGVGAGAAAQQQPQLPLGPGTRF